MVHEGIVRRVAGRRDTSDSDEAMPEERGNLRGALGDSHQEHVMSSEA